MAGDAGAQVEEHAGVRVEKRHSAAVHTLDRPNALNALNEDMVLSLRESFKSYGRDPMVYCVVQRSEHPKAFCAGGDIRDMYTRGCKDPADALAALKMEYAFDWLMECFSKPTISLIDGIVMGSGAGITCYGTHQVAGANYKFAMPETAIGFFPDVGVAHVLGQMADHIGMYLGLTGRRVKRADAFALGLVSHCIDGEHFDEIIAKLADAECVDPLLDDRHIDPGPGELEDYRETIAQCFSAPTVEEILERLAGVKGENRDWASEVRADLARMSPLALKVSHQHIRRAGALDLRETLQVDFRLAARFLNAKDFYEGVRALIIDKDGAPNWSPPILSDVSDDLVDCYFTPLDEGELDLPTRAEMQAARV